MIIKKYVVSILLQITLLYQLNGQTTQAWENLIKDNSLDGWQIVGGGGLFTVKQNTIVGTSVLDSVNTFLITKKEYKNFILELDVMIESEFSNSGIQVRSHFGGSGHKDKVYGKQVEIDPTARRWTGGIYDEERRGWLFPLDSNPAAKKAFVLGKFNHIKIECIEDEIKTWINNIPAAYLKDALDSTGFIGLQVHAAGAAEKPGEKIYFKNIKIKTLHLVRSSMPPAVPLINAGATGIR